MAVVGIAAVVSLTIVVVGIACLCRSVYPLAAAVVLVVITVTTFGFYFTGLISGVSE